jgi:hypothetical protein
VRRTRVAQAGIRLCSYQVMHNFFGTRSDEYHQVGIWVVCLDFLSTFVDWRNILNMEF